MEFKNPLTVLQTIDDVADEYEIQTIGSSKQSETIVYGIALLVEEQRIHTKFIVSYDIEPRRMTTIKFIPHEDLPQLGYFELVGSDITAFVQYKPGPIAKALQYSVLQKLIKIFKSLK